MVFFYFYFVIINLVGDGMNINSIESLLKKKSSSIKEKNILKDFPSIVNDLETIVNIFNKEIEGVTVNQMVCPVYNIELYKTEFLAELMKKYMEFTWQDKFGYEIDDMIFMISSGGYNKKKDIVLLSPLALLLNAGSNTSSALARIIHEYRHQHQFHFFHESDIKKIIKYPSHYMLLTKNRFVKDIHDIYDEEEVFEYNQYYADNHDRMYTEVDANNYALETTQNFLIDLYGKYPHKNKNLEKKVIALQAELLKQCQVIKQEFKDEKRLEPKYLKEIYLKSPITSNVLVDGKETDSLLYIDRTIKNNYDLKENYEILKLIVNDYGFKDYHELILDKYKAIEECGNKEKINAIYDNIINTDPMLLMTKLVEEKDIHSIQKFISDHPTFLKEYKEEINELINNTVPGIEILSLLSKEECIVKKKERR